MDNQTQATSGQTMKKNRTQDSELESVLKAHRTNIRVVGTGGAGNNTLSRLSEVGVAGMETIAVNTDAQDLLHTKAENKLLIGRAITNGLGAGSNPKIGEESALESQEDLKELLEGSDMVFVTCGLGGGTGSGSAPVIADVAKSLGALTIAVVTLPFTEEGVMRQKNAKSGLDQLRKSADTVIVVQNDRLLDIVPDLPLNAAFKIADEILVNAVKGITELVTEKGLVNLDFADVKSIMQDGDTAMIGIGESNSENKAMDAVEKAVLNPLLDVDITGARSALINITGDSKMSIREARSVMHAVAEKLDPNAKIIWGARIDDQSEGMMRVLIIATGLRNGSDDAVKIHTEEHIAEKVKEPVVEKKPIPRAEIKPEPMPAPKPKIETVPAPEPVSKSFTELKPLAKQPIEPIAPVKPQKGKENFFDIKDKPSLDVVAEKPAKKEPIPEKKTEDNLNQKSERKTNKVFTEIFEEEIQGDLNILKRAVRELKKPADEKTLRNMMNACTSIQSSSQLFDYENIEEFTAFICGVLEDILSDDVKINDGLLDMLKSIPTMIERIVSNDDVDIQSFIEQLSVQMEGSNNDQDDLQSNIARDELIVDQEDLKNKLKMELN
ncbi:cell division protein FtsZ [candidate division KSB1 bacterium]|nr:cell division protein FtsZ [candidate division KSB1 bacterium]